MTNPFRYTLAELKQYPTLSVGQFADLKINSGLRRVWLHRTRIEDGEPYNNKVVIEKYINNYWEVVDTYEAK